MRLRWFAIVLLFLPVLVAADESGSGAFGCSLVLGSVDLRVDGSLSDWDSRAATEPLRWPRHLNGELANSGTATARCLVDDAFLYLGVSISASPLRFETMPFNQAWRNDSVELFLSSRAAATSAQIGTGLIRVSSDSLGRVVTEGSFTVTAGTHTTRRFSYPLLWEASGVKTGMQVAPSGYSVEAAIPRQAIGWAGSAGAPQVSINVRVRRSCGQKACRALLQTSDDPFNTSPESSETFRPMSFGRPVRAINSLSDHGSEGEEGRALLFRALVQLDAFESSEAVEFLQKSQDVRLLPVAASALIAAGRLDSALSLLAGIGSGDVRDGARVWAREMMARVRVLQGASSLAEGEYAALAASNDVAVRDIGVAGLIDLALAEGKGDAALATYNTAFGGAPGPGMRSTSRIALWLQKHGRGADAISTITRLSQSEWIDDSERAWALLQLQALHERKGDVAKVAAIGWRLQELAPPGDPSAEAGLRKLTASTNLGQASSSSVPAFSESYYRFLKANPGATDPSRRSAYAEQLRWEGKSDAATALSEDISRDASARQKDRAAALLSLQHLRLQSGEVEKSVETGLAVQDASSQDLNTRLASWRLMRLALAEVGVPISLRQQVEALGRLLAKDVRSLARDSSAAVTTRAQALSLQLDKELNLQ